jgi:DnaJ-domain-containing protein 1
LTVVARAPSIDASKLRGRDFEQERRMKCWNCQSSLVEILICERCGMPQNVGMAGPFQVFNISPRLGWDDTELATKYEWLALRSHPDLFRAHDDARVLTAARSAMRALNDAYRTLRDPVARLRYALAASGLAKETPRTVPEGLQESAQIIGRVLDATERAIQAGDHDGWEAEQDHLASLQVQVEKAGERSHAMLRALFREWDEASAHAQEGWPEMPPAWQERALGWLGERQYLDVLGKRIRAGRRGPIACAPKP